MAAPCPTAPKKQSPQRRSRHSPHNPARMRRCAATLVLMLVGTALALSAIVLMNRDATQFAGFAQATVTSSDMGLTRSRCVVEYRFTVANQTYNGSTGCSPARRHEFPVKYKLDDPAQNRPEGAASSASEAGVWMLCLAAPMLASVVLHDIACACAIIRSKLAASAAAAAAAASAAAAAPTPTATV